MMTLRASYLSHAQAQAMRMHILTLSQRIAQRNAVALIDAIAPPDAILFSPLGRADGEVYKHLYQTIATHPGCFERAKWWHEARVPVVVAARRHLVVDEEGDVST